jgi:hypothetical protein
MLKYPITSPDHRVLQQSHVTSSTQPKPPQIDDRIRRALSWPVIRQQPAAGSWMEGRGVIGCQVGDL